MSLLGAMNTAISGLTAQSAAFGNISDNVANSQTTGYKEVETSFVDYLTTSTTAVNDPGAVVAQPDYLNNIQGTITQVTNPLALAIAGQGFFAVSQQTGEANGIPTFNPQQFYSRAGDFQLNSSGYLINSAGEYLNGWSVDPASGIANQNSLAPIQVTQTVYNPVATSSVTLSANLPATPASGTGTSTTPISSDIDVYDSLGTVHTITLNWVQTSANNWSVQVNCPDSATPDCGTADVGFGPSATGDDIAPSGTIGNLAVDATDPGGVSVSTATDGTPAAVSFNVDFGTGNQAITLNLGNYGGTNGVTQYAGTQYNLEGLTQNGVPPGSFAGVTPQANGDIVVNYNNGQTRTIAQVPLVTFNAPNALQRQDGQSFTATLGSGTPLAEVASTNGAGNLVTGSVESSNVDIATEFSNLIVAQQAYSANAKMVTTAQQMLETTVDMKQ
jgi:flagellar hook protein FlgE